VGGGGEQLEIVFFAVVNLTVKMVKDKEKSTYFL
jgi:hypothetical protein